MLQINLLGYPSVSLDGIPVTDFISQKALVLLCYLAVEARPHSRDYLAGLLWAEMPQERALSNLRQALHNLQKLVPGYVRSNRQTVQFDTSQAFQLDIRLLDDKPEEPAVLLAAYRDTFMAGVVIADAEELDQWLTRQRESYILRYQQYLEEQLNTRLLLGEIVQTEALARHLIAHDAYRETAYHALWRTLVYQGKIREAFQSIEQLRERLSNELEADLSPDTQRIAHQVTLAQSAVRHNIPAVHSLFIGRESEISQIRRRLRQTECRLITITGVGGAGKSRLVQEIGRIESGWYLNGVCYVPLATIVDSISLISVLAEKLGIVLQNVSNAQHKVERFLAEREMLLIFDNAEHLPEFAHWLSNLIAAVPELKIMVTSRHRLGLREEWVFPLDGLPFDPSEDNASVRLLIQTALQHGQKLQRDHDAAALCALLEGLPLAIELAGAIMADNAVELLEQIQRNKDFLQAGWINTDPRHQSLRAAFLTSWQLLSLFEQTALADLAVFKGAFSTEAAAFIAGADEALLQALYTRSLIRYDGARWSLHGVIRPYASEFQTDLPDLNSRFESYYLGIIAQANTIFDARRLSEAVELLRSELDNLYQCWQTALDQRRLHVLIDMSFTLHRFYEGIGWYIEGLTFFQKSLERLSLDPGDERERALLGRLKMHITGMYLRLGRITEAAADAREAVALIEQQKNTDGVLAFSLNLLGIAQLYTGNMSEARLTLERCADIYRQLKMVELLKPLVNLGAIYTRTGEIESALAVLTEAYDIAREMNDDLGAYHVTNSLGLSYMLLDDYECACHHFENALLLSKSSGFLQGEAITSNNLGDVYTLLGHPEKGYEYAEHAVRIARKLQDVRSLIYGLSTLALAQVALGHPDSRDTLKEALKHALASGAEPMMTTALYPVGEWYLSVGQAENACKVWTSLIEHPAVEMDYRRRVKQHLQNAQWGEQAISPDSLPALINHALTILNSQDRPLHLM